MIVARRLCFSSFSVKFVLLTGAVAILVLLLQHRRVEERISINYKLKDLKIKGLVLAGREHFVSILDCYLQRTLRRNGGLLDEVLWILRTNKTADMEYMYDLIDNVPEYRSERVHVDNTYRPSNMFQYCEEDVIYVKLDDDTVFFEDNTISTIVTRLVDNPQYSVISANVINSPIIAWLHYHMGTILPFLPDHSNIPTLTSWRMADQPVWDGPADYNITLDPMMNTPMRHRWLPAQNYDRISMPMDELSDSKEYYEFNSGWADWTLAAQQHASFITHLERDELDLYRFKTWDYNYRRLSINFIVFRGSDLFKYGPMVGDDEIWLTKVMPKASGRPAITDGTSLAVHFGFHTHYYSPTNGSTLLDADLLDRYKLYAEENICGRTLGN